MPLLTDEQFAKLSRAVKAANGRLFMIVHPYYDIHPMVIPPHENNPRYAKILKAIFSQKKIPILVLEEAKSTERLEKTLRGFGVELPPILVTEPDSERLLNSVHLYQEDLAELLKKVGARQILIGGQRTLIDDLLDSKGTGPVRKKILENEKTLNERAGITKPNEYLAILAGCAGATYSNLLKHGLKARLVSPAVYPFRTEYWSKLNALQMNLPKPVKEIHRKLK